MHPSPEQLSRNAAQIPGDASATVTTDLTMSNGVNQSKTAPITKTVNCYVYTATKSTPTTVICKCLTVTPYGHLVTLLRILTPSAALSNAAPTVYLQIPDATTLPMEGGDDGTEPGKAGVNTSATVAGSFSDTTHCTSKGSPAMAGSSFSASPKVSADSSTDNTMLPPAHMGSAAGL